MLDLSIIICAYNPKENYFQRVIDSLRNQNIEQSKWEFIIVDNNSTNEVIGLIDLSWHSYARVVVEKKPGLTAARVRGIQESTADILIFVDDDTVLDADYLSNALQIANDHPDLGVWGSARIIPEFEERPPDELLIHTNVLALRNQSSDTISNSPQQITATPYGAGLCCRKEVAIPVMNCFQNHKIFSMLGRNGTTLLSGEDIQFSYEAAKLGMKIGTFISLNIIHLIPKFRVSEKYIRECLRGHSTSEVLLKYANFGVRGWDLKKKLSFIKNLLFFNNFDRVFLFEYLGGMLSGLCLIDKINKDHSA